MTPQDTMKDKVEKLVDSIIAYPVDGLVHVPTNEQVYSGKQAILALIDEAVREAKVETAQDIMTRLDNADNYYDVMFAIFDAIISSHQPKE